MANWPFAANESLNVRVFWKNKNSRETQLRKVYLNMETINEDSNRNLAAVKELDSFDLLLKDHAYLIREPLLTASLLNVPSNAPALKCAIDVGQGLLNSDFYQIVVAFRSFCLTMKSCTNTIWIDRTHLKTIDEVWKRYFLLTMAPEEIYREVLMLSIKMKWMVHESNGKPVLSCSTKDEMLRIFQLVAEKAQYLPDDKFLDAVQRINPSMKCMIFSLNTRLPRGLRNLSTPRSEVGNLILNDVDGLSLQRRDLFDEFFDDHSSLLRFPRQIHKLFSTRFIFPTRWRPYRRIDFTKKQNLSTIMLIGLSKKPQNPNQYMSRLHCSSEKILLISECDTCYKFQQISEEQHKEIYFSTVIIHVPEDVYDKYNDGYDISKRASAAFDLLVKMLFNVKHDNFFVYDMLTNFREVFRMKKSMGRLWNDRNKYPPSDMLWKHLLLLSSAPENIYQEMFNLAWLNYKTSYDCSRLYSTYTTEIFAVLAKKSYVYGEEDLLTALKALHPTFENADMVMNSPLPLLEDTPRRMNYVIDKKRRFGDLFSEVEEETDAVTQLTGDYEGIELIDVSSIDGSRASSSRNSISLSEPGTELSSDAEDSDLEYASSKESLHPDRSLLESVSSIEEFNHSFSLKNALEDEDCNICKIYNLVDSLKDNLTQYQQLHKCCRRATIPKVDKYHMVDDQSCNITPVYSDDGKSVDCEHNRNTSCDGTHHYLEMSPSTSNTKCSCSTISGISSHMNDALSMVYVLQPLTNLIERLQKLGYRIEDKLLKGILIGR